VGKSVSQYYPHAAWERTELQWVYGNAGMTEMDWVIGADGDTGVMEIDVTTGSIYSGGPSATTLVSV